ncbi:MAG: hypothetical protein IKV76_03860 [Clostridia bacterium]|nr:hypothetical protein [Clostridia bacterium]
MFVILNVVSSGKKKTKKGKAVRKVSEFRTNGGERFYIVDVNDSANGVDWDEVTAFIGKHSSRVLAGENIRFGDDCSVKKFTGEKFFNMLIFNTLSIIIKELYLSGLRTKCYINDKKGQYAFLLPLIARYSAETIVITKNDYRYFSQVQSVYDEIGAGVVITDSIKDAESHSIIIDTDNTFDYRGKGFLFSACRGFIPAKTEGFDDIKKLCPGYIDENVFLAAVNEFNFEKRLSRAYCLSFIENNEEITVTELVEYMKNRICASADRYKSIIFYV